MQSVKKIVMLAAAGALIVGLSACKEKQQQAKQEAGPVAVTAVKVQTYDLPISRSFVGKVTSYDKVDIKPRVSGILKKRAFTEGAVVKKNALLYNIEKDQYVAAFHQAEANLARAEAEAVNAQIQLDRALQLIKTGDVSKSVLDNREASAAAAMAVVKQAKAALEDAKLNLDYTDIRAPFTGKIGLTNYDEGEYITPASGTLATILSVDPMGVVFSASMQDIMAMYANSKGETPEIMASLTLVGGKKYPQEGKIDFVDNLLNQQTDTLKMRAKFENSRATLMDGAIVTVKIMTVDKYPTIVIPQAALQQDQAGHYVMVVKDGKTADLRRIITGEAEGSYMVVSSGLAVGEVIVVDGLQKIKQGSAVTVTEKSMEEYGAELEKQEKAAQEMAK